MKRIIQTIVLTAAMAVVQTAWSAPRDWQPSPQAGSPYPLDAEASFVREPLGTYADRHGAGRQGRDGQSMSEVASVFPVDAESSFLREPLGTYADRHAAETGAAPSISAALPYPIDAETSFFHALVVANAGGGTSMDKQTGQPFTANLAAKDE